MPSCSPAFAGVGKTSTARLIAKALNCIGPDGQGGPTISPCNVCEPCRAIAEGRHIDVIEMDAASHTGIDDIREIIDAVRYASVSARYKIYIIDEVHMLSKSAFNALLKTLEEPPEHVKFLFATTEVNKVPVTVLSRCQRFDLRRIPAEKLAAHFAEVVEGGRCRGRAGSAWNDREGGRRLRSRRPFDPRPGHRSWRGSGHRRTGPRHARPRRPRPDPTPAATRARRRRDRGAWPSSTRLTSSASIPTQLLRGLMESLHAATRAKAGATADALQSAEEREAAAEMAAAAVLGHDPSPVADAAQGTAGCRDRARPARGRGDGAAASDPCRRHARPAHTDRTAER